MTWIRTAKGGLVQLELINYVMMRVNGTDEPEGYLVVAFADDGEEICLAKKLTHQQGADWLEWIESVIIRAKGEVYVKPASPIASGTTNDG